MTYVPHAVARLPREQLLAHVASCVRALFAVARCLPSHAARERRELSEALHNILVRTLFPEGYKPPPVQTVGSQPPPAGPEDNVNQAEAEGGSFGANMIGEGASAAGTGGGEGAVSVGPSSPPQVGKKQSESISGRSICFLSPGHQWSLYEE